MNIEVVDRKSLQSSSKVTLAIADGDIHPRPKNPEEVQRYLPKRWQEHAQTYGFLPRHGFLKGPAYPKVMPDASRRDAVTPSGGRPGSDVGFLGTQLLDGGRWMVHTQRGGDARHIGHVLIGFVAGKRCGPIPVVRGEEAVDLADVDPAQQMRIAGRVGATVQGHPAHTAVDLTDAGDRFLRRCGWAESGRRQEVGRALEAAPRVFAIVGMVGNTSHRQRMQRLQQQRTQAANEHRRVGVHSANHPVLRKPTLARRTHHRSHRWLRTVTNDPRPDLAGNPGTGGFPRRRHYERVSHHRIRHGRSG